MRINGTNIEIGREMTLKDLLESKGYKISRVAVELNGDIVPKSRYDHVIVSDGDSLEIVSIVGGG
jgi:sulfur carrier protein